MTATNHRHEDDPKEAGFAVLRSDDHWLQFGNPSAILTANRIEDVIPQLEQVEQATTSGCYAAGFITFEAASAFDSALQTHQPGRCCGLVSTTKFGSLKACTLHNQKTFNYAGNHRYLKHSTPR